MLHYLYSIATVRKNFSLTDLLDVVSPIAVPQAPQPARVDKENVNPYSDEFEVVGPHKRLAFKGHTRRLEEEKGNMSDEKEDE